MITGLSQQTGKPSFRPQALRMPSVASDRMPHLPTPGLHADRTCLERVAAFLVSISRNNSYEGRDPDIIPDSLTLGFVADLLGLSVSGLAHSIVQLEHQGLVAKVQGGSLRLLDPPALERLIDVR